MRWQRYILEQAQSNPTGFWLNDLLRDFEDNRTGGDRWNCLHRAARTLARKKYIVIEHKKPTVRGRTFITPGPKPIELKRPRCITVKVYIP